MTLAQEKLMDLIRSQGLSEDDLEMWSVLLPFFSDKACAMGLAVFDGFPENTRLVTDNLQAKATLAANGDMNAFWESAEHDEEALFSRLL